MSQMTLAEFYDRTSAAMAASVRETTWRGYKCAWKHRVFPSLGHLPLDQIDALAIEEAFMEWTGTRSTKDDAKALLGRTLKRAKRSGLIAQNPMLDVELPRSPSFDPAARALSTEEFRRLLRHVTDPVYRDPLIALHGMGLRWSEMAALDPVQVNFDTLQASISQSMTPNGRGSRTLTTTKSGHSRSVPVSEIVLAAMRRSIDRADSLGVHDRVFVGPKGGILDGANVARAIRLHDWRDQVKRFPRLEPALRFHDLRHTAAVNLFKSGMDARVVQRILGHSSLQVTQIYAQSSDAELNDARIKLDEFNAANRFLEIGDQ